MMRSSPLFAVLERSRLAPPMTDTGGPKPDEKPDEKPPDPKAKGAAAPVATTAGSVLVIVRLAMPTAPAP